MPVLMAHNTSKVRRGGAPQRAGRLGGTQSRHDLVVGITLLTALIGAVAFGIWYGVVAYHPGHGSAGRPASAPTMGSFGSTSTSTTLTGVDATAYAWETQISTDFAPMESVLQTLLQTVDSWEAGTAKASLVTQQIQNFWPDFTATEQALAKQSPFAPAPLALDDYKQSVNLYVESMRMVAVAAQSPSGQLTRQLQLSATRARDLGDRIFDQATATLAPFSPPSPPTPGVTIVQPPDVPSWASTGLAPGPPLAPAAPLVPVAVYQQTRSVEPLRAWQQQVGGTQLPAPSREAHAIRAGTAAELGQMSTAFNQAVITLTGDPDPAAGGRLAGTRTRLGLLVDAEATRAAEAADLEGSLSLQSQLRQIAETLAVIGDDLWDPQLPPRSTGFPVSLLAAG